MGTTDAKKIRAAVNKLAARKTIKLDDVLSFAAAALAAHGGGLAREQDAIAGLREEVARLQARDLTKTQLPDARLELDTARAATEAAATHILSCAEVVMAGNAKEGEAYRLRVDKTMLEILEACAFQDVCGQHLAKAAGALDHIEERISRFAGVTGIGDRKGTATPRETRDAQRRRDLMLNGPATGGDGLNQDDIDALFAD